MSIIFCNIQLFSYDQMVHVINAAGNTIHCRKVDIEQLVPALCAMADEFNADNIKLSSSGSVYTNSWANEVRSALAMNYSNKNITVEVV